MKGRGGGDNVVRVVCTNPEDHWQALGGKAPLGLASQEAPQQDADVCREYWKRSVVRSATTRSAGKVSATRRSHVRSGGKRSAVSSAARSVVRTLHILVDLT